MGALKKAFGKAVLYMTMVSSIAGPALAQDGRVRYGAGPGGRQDAVGEAAIQYQAEKQQAEVVDPLRPWANDPDYKRERKLLEQQSALRMQELQDTAQNRINAANVAESTRHAAAVRAEDARHQAALQNIGSQGYRYRKTKDWWKNTGASLMTLENSYHQRIVTRENSYHVQVSARDDVTAASISARLATDVDKQQLALDKAIAALDTKFEKEMERAIQQAERERSADEKAADKTRAADEAAAAKKKAEAEKTEKAMAAAREAAVQQMYKDYVKTETKAGKIPDTYPDWLKKMEEKNKQAEQTPPKPAPETPSPKPPGMG